MASPSILLELGLILGIAAVLALAGRFIKQPTLIAYLITGIIVGPLFLNLLQSENLIQIFAHLGVAFLLFIVGLSLDFRVLKEIGGVATTAGIAQVIITGVLGFLIAVALGFSNISALFLAAALAFSSTVFVVKLLTDKKEIDTLHGKIALGILIVQDFAAAIVLLLIPIIGSAGTVFIPQQILIGVLLIAAVFIFTHLIIPGILSLAARNQEVLFLFSIGWALLIAILFQTLGFSIEIGALVAGMTLASSKFSLEIGSKIRSLREFFVIIHLVFFGSLLVGPITKPLIINSLIFSALILIGNPLIIMTFLKFFGYKKRTSFLTGISIAQISEFSLILVFLGFSLGALSQEILSLTILTALITIALSSYSIYYSRPIYSLLSPILSIFDSKGKRIGHLKRKKHYDVILFGYNRVGFNLLKAFDRSKKKYLVVDYNPKTISDLSKKKIHCVYGDANDTELLHKLRLDDVKIVISTIPELETNMSILKNIKDESVMFIPTSHHTHDTQKLYEAGADYVIMPHFLGGDFMAHMLLKENFNKKFLERQSKKHLNELAERMAEGHEHPRKDHHGH